MRKYNGLPKATYYARLKNWTLELFDKDGNAYYVSPKHIMQKDEQESISQLETKANEELEYLNDYQTTKR